MTSPLESIGSGRGGAKACRSGGARNGQCQERERRSRDRNYGWWRDRNQGW